MEKDDVLAATLIALIVLVIAAVWRWRLRPGQLAGRWTSRRDGRVYIIAGGAGRAFVLSGGGGSYAATPGRIGRLRSLGVGPLRGHVAYDGRTISWKNGDAWIRQGVP